MVNSAEWLNQLNDGIVSYMAGLGHFERVNNHEVNPEPGNGLTASVWPLMLRPVQSSGLRISSALIVENLRIYGSLISEPRDDIDPPILAAAGDLMAKFHDDFDFDGLTVGSITVRNVDLLGMEGEPLRMDTGYLQIGEASVYRICDIKVPIILNDVWTQGGA